VDWADAHDCELCRKVHEKQVPPEIPDCLSCRTVELKEENIDAANVFMLTRKQYVTAEQGTPVDINLDAVKAAMGWLEVEDEFDCVMRVRNVFFEFLSRRGDG